MAIVLACATYLYFNQEERLASAEQKESLYGQSNRVKKRAAELESGNGTNSDKCESSIYRVVAPRLSAKSPLFFESTDGEGSTIEETATFHSNLTLLDAFPERGENEDWSDFLSRIAQGEFPLTGVYRGKPISLFDFIYQAGPPQDVVQALIDLNIRPTTYSFAYFSQFPYLGKEKLEELERFTEPDLDYRVTHKGKEVNLATYSQLSKNYVALSYWQSKGLSVELKEELALIEPDIHTNESTVVEEVEQVSEVKQEATQFSSELERLLAGEYKYFTLLEVLNCPHSEDATVLDVDNDKQIDQLLANAQGSHEEKLAYFDQLNPMYTEIYLESESKKEHFEALSFEKVFTNLEQFQSDVQAGLVNKNTRIYSSAPERGLNILDYFLYFGAEEEFVSYLFENNYPLSMRKLANTLSISDHRERVFDILEANHFDFSKTQQGKNLLHHAIFIGSTELVLFLKGKGVGLVEEHGVDALEYILRSPYSDYQDEMLPIVGDLYPKLKQRHLDILDNLKSYEPARYQALMTDSFLKERISS